MTTAAATNVEMRMESETKTNDECVWEEEEDGNTPASRRFCCVAAKGGVTGHKFDM